MKKDIICPNCYDEASPHDEYCFGCGHDLTPDDEPTVMVPLPFSAPQKVDTPPTPAPALNIGGEYNWNPEVRARFQEGVMGDLACYMWYSSPLPDDALARGVAFATVAHIACRSYVTPLYTAPNLYIALLADSGAGKAQAMGGMKTLLSDLDRLAGHTLLSPMVKSGFASPQAVHEIMIERGLGFATIHWTEIDKAMGQSKSSPMDKAKLNALLNPYGDGLKAWHADTAKSLEARRPSVHHGSLNVVADGTEEHFFGNMDAEGATGGQLSRFFPVPQEYGGQPPLNPERAKFEHLLAHRNALRAGAHQDRLILDLTLDETIRAIASSVYEETDGGIGVKLMGRLSTSLMALVEKVVEVGQYVDTTGQGILESGVDPEENQNFINLVPNRVSVNVWPDVLERMQDIHAELQGKMSRSSDVAERGLENAPWVRAYENSVRLATLMAIINNPEAPILGMDDLNLAHKFVVTQSKRSRERVGAAANLGGNLAMKSFIREWFQKPIEEWPKRTRQTHDERVGGGVFSSTMVGTLMKGKKGLDMKDFFDLVYMDTDQRREECLLDVVHEEVIERGRNAGEMRQYYKLIE